MAFVHNKTASGVGYAWKNSCVSMTGFPTNLPLMTRDETSAAMAAAARAWSKQDAAVGACSYLDVGLVVDTVNVPPPAANDGTHAIIIRRDTWCPHSPNCYDPTSLALTSLFARTSTGEIIDADIEVNAVNYSWSDTTLRAPTGDEQDLQNALTHEMGHVIGLDHTCYGGTGDRPTDENGIPIPDCVNAPQSVVDTTMFPSANALDIGKRTLADDDLMGVCAIYPLASDPMVCPPPPSPDAGRDAEPPRDAEQSVDATGNDAVGDSESASKKSGCSCDVSGPAGSMPAVLVAALLVVSLLLRRRRMTPPA
ncbi:MAG TPA: MYXO-CTERM sorting domain-containing protein [Polyangia bacterium]|nr:MYXO-CTERM sorting domain-containing protein [Polyangia bacterium]